MREWEGQSIHKKEREREKENAREKKLGRQESFVLISNFHVILIIFFANYFFMH